MSETGQNMIRKVEIGTGVVTTLSGATTSGATNGTGVSARFNQPYGMWGNGTYLYLAEQNNHLIRKIEIETGVVTTLAGDGTAATVDGVGTGVSFLIPRHIWGNGISVFVADQFSIQRLFNALNF
jgi:hypothetical protein